MGRGTAEIFLHPVCVACFKSSLLSKATRGMCSSCNRPTTPLAPAAGSEFIACQSAHTRYDKTLADLSNLNPAQIGM